MVFPARSHHRGWFSCPSTKAGILDDNFAELDSIESTSDELDDLIHQRNMPAETRCSVREYVNGDDELPTSSVLDDETREEDIHCFRPTYRTGRA